MLYLFPPVPSSISKKSSPSPFLPPLFAVRTSSTASPSWQDVPNTSHSHDFPYRFPPESFCSCRSGCQAYPRSTASSFSRLLHIFFAPPQLFIEYRLPLIPSPSNIVLWPPQSV